MSLFTIEKLQADQPLYGVWCCGAVFISHRHAEEHKCSKQPTPTGESLTGRVARELPRAAVPGSPVETGYGLRRSLLPSEAAMGPEEGCPVCHGLGMADHECKLPEKRGPKAVR